jgi:3-phosphoshikimate 1-carboxyvinyltransferase
MNPTRTGVIGILTRMGADIRINNRREVGGNRWRICMSGRRRCTVSTCRPNWCPAIDEFPALFVAAACASGRTVLTGRRNCRSGE